MSTLDVGLVVVVALLAVTVVALVRTQAATARRLDVVERRLLRAQRRSADRDPSVEEEAVEPQPVRTPSPEVELVGTPPPPAEELDEDVVDLRGVSVDGDPTEVALAGASRPVLVAFLSTTCGICRSLWATLGDEGLDAVDLVVVTKDPAVEEVEVAQELAGRHPVPVVMSSEAWVDYEVPGSPYFLLVDRDQVVTEGEASSWAGVQALAGSLG